METVLVIGATGNIGVAAIHGALKAGRKVLAIVRNETSANKLFHHIGTKEGITTVEADIMSDTGVQSVVDQVKTGKLPSFQHVYSTAGGAYQMTPLPKLDTKTLRASMLQNFESNFFAYRATIPYLLEQNYPSSSYTLCTGSQGDLGFFPMPAMTQGALFSMVAAATRELSGTNVRFNEVWLNGRVEVDESAEKSGAMKASDFGKNYQKLLDRPDINGCRVSVSGPADFEDLKFKPKHEK